MKCALVFAAIVLFGVGTAAAQAPGPIRDRSGSETPRVDRFVVGEVKGNVPAKAVRLVKPDYPAEARWAGVEGEVRVQITIDTNGNVSNAELLAGDPRLAEAGIDAARRTKFRITKNDAGQPIEVKGVLAYNFSINRASWTEIGWGLSVMDRLPAAALPVPTMKKALQPGWDKEMALLAKLDDIRLSQPRPARPQIVRSPAVTTGSASDTSARSSMMATITLPEPPSPEQKAIAAELLSALQARLANESSNLWRLNLGVALRNAFEYYRNPVTRDQAAAAVRTSLDLAPAGVPPELLKALRDLESFFGRPARDINTPGEIAALQAKILSVD